MNLELIELRKELSSITGELYIKDGLTEEVVRLSELLDKLVVIEQKESVLIH